MKKLSTPIAKYLRNNTSWHEATTNCKLDFREQMKGHAYGYEACNDAWIWFFLGWMARHDRIISEKP